MLDELAHAGPEHLDEGFIAGYDRKQGYPDPTADIAALEGHGLDGQSVVVDFGAGTGQFALPAAERFGRVTAVDVSPVMLAALRAKADAAASVNGAGLECVRGGFLSYTAADYAEHIRTEYSTFRWLLEPMLAATGFEVTGVSFHRRLYGAYTCVKTGNG